MMPHHRKIFVLLYRTAFSVESDRLFSLILPVLIFTVHDDDDDDDDAPLIQP